MDIQKPKLTPEEEKMPLSKYYHLPLHEMGPLYKMAIANSPLSVDDMLSVHNWQDHLQLPGIYKRPVIGYGLMEDGTGYIAHYSVYPSATPKMMSWYFRWLNLRCKSQPEGVGNMRYKIWCPSDHFNHGFVNGVDKTDGVFTQESLDLQYGKTELGPMMYTIRYPWDLRACGLSEERERELQEAGVWIDPAIVKYATVEEPHEPMPGTSLFLTMSRPCPTGGMEKLSIEWMGWDFVDGKIVRDETEPAIKLTNEWMLMGLTHATTEAQHLSEFLPMLYEEYHDKPDDAD